MSSIAYRPAADAAVTVAGIGCLAGVAVTHIADLPDKLEEAHYMAALFVGLIASSLVLAIALAVGYRRRLAWRAGAVLCVLTLIGYVLSRTVGLPQLEDHVGMWLDPWGIAACTCEVAFIGLALRAR